MRIFGGERIAAMMERMKVDEETPIENRLISRSLEGAQKKVEGFHFDQRKNVVQYDDVMNRHRKAVYAMRKEILRSGDISKRVKIFIDEQATMLAASPELLTDHFEDNVRDVFPFDDAALDRLFDTPSDKFGGALTKAGHELYEGREAAFTSEMLRHVERDIYLQVLDNLWMQHLENMDHLREGIHWMSVGQRDPLVEYRRQAQRLFDAMQIALRHDVLQFVFNAQPVDAAALQRATETELTRAARSSISNANKILDVNDEFEAADFRDANQKANAPVAKKPEIRKKARKAERKRKAQGRKHK
jgi:preprotein translocase subunit SecA